MRDDTAVSTGFYTVVPAPTGLVAVFRDNDEGCGYFSQTIVAFGEVVDEGRSAWVGLVLEKQTNTLMDPKDADNFLGVIASNEPVPEDWLR